MRQQAGGPTSTEEISDVELTAELMSMVDDGFLKMGVGDDGKPVFWATESGMNALGMTS